MCSRLARSTSRRWPPRTWPWISTTTSPAWGQRDDFYDSAWNTVTLPGQNVRRADPVGATNADVPQGHAAKRGRSAMRRPTGTTSNRSPCKPPSTTATNSSSAASMRDPIWQQYMWFLFQNGGDVFTPDGQVVVNSPEAVERWTTSVDCSTKTKSPASPALPRQPPTWARWPPTWSRCSSAIS